MSKLPLVIAAAGGIIIVASLTMASDYENPRNTPSERFVTWFGDAAGHHGSWVYTWSDTPVAMDVIRHARLRGYEAGRVGQIGENPADFQTGRSSPDLRLVNVWYDGYQQGQAQVREERRRPTLRLRPVRNPARNPWTPPGTYWPVYEYKVTPDPKSRSRDGRVHRWLVTAFVRNSTPTNDPLFPMRPQNVPASKTDFSAVEFSFVTRQEAIDWAKGHAQFVAMRQVRNPNPVRILDERGVCIYSLKYTPKAHPRSGGWPPKVVDYWGEIPC